MKHYISKTENDQTVQTQLRPLETLKDFCFFSFFEGTSNSPGHLLEFKGTNNGINQLKDQIGTQYFV